MLSLVTLAPRAARAERYSFRYSYQGPWSSPAQLRFAIPPPFWRTWWFLRIKQDPSLKTIPVIMLSSSEQEVDISRSYQSGANSYVAKPIQFAEFVERVSRLELYWVVNHLPESRPAEEARV